MQLVTNNKSNESIPSKRYFTIGEVSDLCDVKSHVLRYWEQEFPMLSPVKRRGNRRYYQRHDVLLIRQIRSLLYEQGYTIEGAKVKINNPEIVSSSTNTNNQIVSQLKRDLEELLELLNK